MTMGFVGVPMCQRAASARDRRSGFTGVPSALGSFALIGCSRGRRRSRILTVELSQLEIELRVFRAQLARLLEEHLGHHGEELGRTGRPVAIDRVRWCRSVSRTSSSKSSPSTRVQARYIARRGKVGRAVARAVFLIELVRELVQHDVVAVVDVRGARQHAVPGQDHHVARPRFAQAGLRLLIGEASRRPPPARHEKVDG